jgi:hypothetical protein
MNLPDAPIAHEGFNRGWEWRCYMRDPDGYLIEVGQYTKIAIDWFNNHS